MGMKNSRPNASAVAERTTAMSFVVKGAACPVSIAHVTAHDADRPVQPLAGQRPSKIVDQPREHPMRVASPIELAVEPRPETRRVPDVLQRDLGGSAFEAQREERLGPRAMVDLHPAEGVRRREVDDFDDRFVLMRVALEGQLVARTFSGLLLAPRG